MTFFWQRLPNTAPSRDDYNYYINFVLYAVLGRMAESDALMRLYGDGVRRVAARLRTQRAVPKRPLYRGVLLGLGDVIDGQLKPDPRLRFISWTEDLDVACWFADPDSVMSAFMRSFRPNTQGFIVSADQPPAPVLFYYEWARGFDLAGRRVDLAKLALPHPDMGEEGYSQIRWALDTQREVITENTDKVFDVAPVDDYECPSTRALDDALTWPGARA